MTSCCLAPDCFCTALKIHGFVWKGTVESSHCAFSPEWVTVSLAMEPSSYGSDGEGWRRGAVVDPQLQKLWPAFHSDGFFTPSLSLPPFSLPHNRCFLRDRKWARLPVTVLFHVVTSLCLAKAVDVLCECRGQTSGSLSLSLPPARWTSFSDGDQTNTGSHIWVGS